MLRFTGRYFITLNSMTEEHGNTPDAWDDAEVISVYSREQAISDGVLVDVSALAKEAGFKVPVATTAAVFALLDPAPNDAELGQSFQGRLWDVLNLLRANARDGDTVLFDVLIAQSGKRQSVQLKAVIGPGDDAAPVITVMLPVED
jgi:hypothetical protein